MVSWRIGTMFGISVGLVVAAAGSARAQSPGLYYAWRSIDGDAAACIERATTALTNEALDNIQVEDNSVAATTEDSTAVFVCLENSTETTVMIMVSSTDDDTAFTLREMLKEGF